MYIRMNLKEFFLLNSVIQLCQEYRFVNNYINYE